MKGKIIIFILTAVLVFSNIIAAQGVERNEIKKIEPFYEETASYSANFDIDSNGKAEIKGVLKLLESSTANKVYAVIKITNMTTGKVVYNKKITLVYSKLQKRYTLNESYPLPTKGRYKMELTYQCCDENKILESLQATPKVKTYA